jgi:hypothetical protein
VFSSIFLLPYLTSHCFSFFPAISAPDDMIGAGSAVDTAAVFYAGYFNIVDISCYQYLSALQTSRIIDHPGQIAQIYVMQMLPADLLCLKHG